MLATILLLCLSIERSIRWPSTSRPIAMPSSRVTSCTSSSRVAMLGLCMQCFTLNKFFLSAGKTGILGVLSYFKDLRNSTYFNLIWQLFLASLCSLSLYSFNNSPINKTVLYFIWLRMTPRRCGWTLWGGTTQSARTTRPSRTSSGSSTSSTSQRWNQWTPYKHKLQFIHIFTLILL